MTVITNFIKHIFPVNNKNLPLHLDNLFLICQLLVAKKRILLDFVIPKYLNDTSIILRLKACEYILKLFLSTPKLLILLL